MSAEQWQIVASSNPDLVYETDLDWQISWISPSVQELLGFDPGELVGTSGSLLYHPTALGQVEEQRRELLTGVIVPRREVRYANSAGRYRWMSTQAVPVTDARGVVQAIRVTAHDIHDEVLNRRARATLSAVQGVLIRAVAEEEMLREVCATVAEVGGYRFAWYGRPGAAPSYEVGLVAWGGDDRGYLDGLHVTWDEGPSGLGPTGSTVRTGRSHLTRDFWSDPRTLPWRQAAIEAGIRASIALPVFVEGQLDGVLTVYGEAEDEFDADAQSLLEDLARALGYGIAGLRAREAVRVSEARYRVLAENASDVVLLVDADGSYTWVSPSVEQALGWLPEEVIGRTGRDFVHPADDTELVAALSALAAGQSHTQTLRIRHSDGTWRWFAGVVTRLIDNSAGITLGRIVSLRDVGDQVRAQHALEESESRYRMLAENSADFIVSLDGSGEITWVSPSVTRTLGWLPEEMIGHPGSSFLHPDDAITARQRIAEVGVGHAVTGRARLRSKGGEHIWFQRTIRPVFDDSGAVVARISGWQNIQTEVEAEQALAASEAQYRLLAENASDMVVKLSRDSTIEWVSPSSSDLLGWEPDELVGTNAADLLHPEDLAAMNEPGQLDADRSATPFEARYRRRDGRYVWLAVAPKLLHGPAGEIVGRVAATRDISVEKQARDSLEYQAFHDALTGLHNRNWLIDILQVELHRASQRDEPIAVLMFDLDDFKLVNDSLGHVAGDQVLVNTTERLESSIGPDDLLARFSSDEFVVVLTHAPTATHASREAARLSDLLAREQQIRGTSVVVTASSGIALSNPESTPESLLREADSARFQAKSKGKGRWHFFNPSMHEQAVNRLLLTAQLREAIEHDEFRVYYQPIVDLADLRVAGYEALVRWDHPSRGLLSPGQFLDVAQEAGLIIPIGEKVLDRICRLLRDRKDLQGTISVNLSPLDLAEPAWAHHFLTLVDKFGIDPAKLVIEITETAVLNRVAEVAQETSVLRQMGVGLHLDDFGTGYSSISLLRDLPITGVKLDQTFTAHITEADSTAPALAAGLAALVRSLELHGIAEGIETNEQARILTQMGWSHGQGYLFGKPAPNPS